MSAVGESLWKCQRKYAIQCTVMPLITWQLPLYLYDCSLPTVHTCAARPPVHTLFRSVWALSLLCPTWLGYQSGSPTAVQAWRPCPLWEPSPSHPYYCRLGDFLCFCMCMCVYCVFCVYFCLPSVLWYCWLGLLTCKTVSQITYTVLVETLTPAHSLTPTWLLLKLV